MIGLVIFFLIFTSPKSEIGTKPSIHPDELYFFAGSSVIFKEYHVKCCIEYSNFNRIYNLFILKLWMKKFSYITAWRLMVSGSVLFSTDHLH